MPLSKTILTLFAIIGLTSGYSQCPLLSSEDADLLRKNGYKYIEYYSYDLKQGGEFWNKDYKYLYDYNDYIIVFEAESGVTDLDGYILSTSGDILVSDVELGDNGYVALSYSPLVSKYVRIKAKISSAWCTTCSYCVRFWIYYR